MLVSISTLLRTKLTNLYEVYLFLGLKELFWIFLLDDLFVCELIAQFDKIQLDMTPPAVSSYYFPIQNEVKKHENTYSFG